MTSHALTHNLYEWNYPHLQPGTPQSQELLSEALEEEHLLINLKIPKQTIKVRMTYSSLNSDSGLLGFVSSVTFFSF